MQLSERAEWRKGWTVVLAALAGTIAMTLAANVLGALIPFIQHDTGWNRREISLGASIFFAASFVLLPAFGALADKIGVRAVAAPGVALYGLGLICLSFAGPDLTSWLVGWVLLGAGYSAMNSVWSAGIAGHFNVGRGLAIAVGISGVGVTSIAAPYVGSILADELGWRRVYLAMAAFPLLIALPLVLAFFSDARFAHRPASAMFTALMSLARSRKATASATRAAKAPPPQGAPMAPGLSIGQIFRSRNFWQLTAAGFLLGATASGFVVHLVPMLINIGQAPKTAAALMAAIGSGTILGRLIGGYLLDRFHGSRVAAAFMMIAAVGVAGLLSGYNNTLYLAGVLFLVGLAVGTEADCIPYLSSKYFGLRNLGLALASMGGFIALGQSLGPLLAGWIYDIFGTYWRYQVFVVIGFALATFFFLGLGPYPDLQPGRTASEPDEAKRPDVASIDAAA